MANKKSLAKDQNNIVRGVQTPTPGMTPPNMPPLPNMDQNAFLLAQQKYHSGPLPDPEELIRYNAAVPDAANRIIQMAENQASHRQNIEKSVVDTQNRNSTLGIIIGAILSLIIVISGVYCILHGHDGAGAVLVSVDIVGLCAVFVYGTKVKKET